MQSKPSTKEMGLATFVVTSLVGTAFEWYDFFISSSAAALAWPFVFFPKAAFGTAILLSFTAFGVGIASRPFGAIIFGHIGDRSGRKSALLWTLITMGLATFLISILPGYLTFGVFAGVLLSILRFVQGLGLGGEWGDVNTWIVEHKSQSSKRTLWTVFSQWGVPIGLISSSALFTYILNTTSHSFFLSYGWRIPFWIGTALLLIGAFMRYKALDSPLFETAVTQKRIITVPIIRLFRDQWKRVLLGSLVVTSDFVIFYIALFAEVIIYSTGLSKSFATETATLMGVGLLFTYPAFSYLSDKIGRNKTLLVGTLWGAVWAFPYFELVKTGNAALVILAQMLTIPIVSGSIFAVVSAYFPELFPVEYRATGAGMSYQLAGVLGGAVPPIIASYLIGIYGVVGSWVSLAIMVELYAVISLVALLPLFRVRISPTKPIGLEPSG